MKEMNTVTYFFEDSTKVQQPINKKAFFNDKGKQRSEEDMNKLFTDTMIDKGAKSYQIDAESDDTIVIEKELHFSKADKKQAKKDFKHAQTSPDFIKSLKRFQNELSDKFAFSKRRLKFNLKSINLVS